VTRALAALVVVAAIAAAAPSAARAHEVLHEVEPGRAVAVRAYFADGEALAYAAYEVYSPADPNLPHQKGRTDRNGWLAFVPDVAGKWRVKVVDASGHGLDLQVDAAPGAAATAAPRSTAALLLRPLAGLAVIAAVFGALVAAYRRRGPVR
jgi:nickel transport protein